MPHELTLPSFAKVNLYLRVLGRRDDGYHELCTVFQTISLHDTITFIEADDLYLTWNQRAISVADDNLIIKAAKQLRSHFRTNQGARISLVKTIPAPGGLGGGSSNAAVALLGLSKLWKLRVDLSLLEKMAAAIGSDVTFFLHGGAALGNGRGEMIEELPDLAIGPMLVVTPDVAISTPEAFYCLSAPNLTKQALNRNLSVCRNEAKSPDLLHSALKNDFEASVFDDYPEVRRAKETLLALGAQNVAMSGSGASVFAIFDKEETRQAALKALDKEVNWRKFAVAAISRAEYREALKLVF
ncbi:MAG TPA: 4-(cytidine 5'-diphospho)-2-C-methyl-D-erythritol kinase [Pyrinomonadaceae bacterium]|nr:4-(cytidine 5'-diphospho)-2-C-methyl-D-erythritol kinase [Pyrinomonadaceae bacterium]